MEAMRLRSIVIILVLLFVFAAIIPCSAAKLGLPEPVIPECLGVNINLTGDNDKQVKMIADAGFRLVRMDFLWEWVEKEKGKYDFTEYDKLMASLDKYGIRPLFIFDYGNPNYPNSTVPSDDATRNAFAAFTGASAAHFKDRGIIWEIWNEPNYRAFSAEVYAKMALAASKAIRQADPTATVTGPALATIDLGFLDGIL
jgi:beta-galactosidase GanA